MSKRENKKGSSGIPPRRELLKARRQEAGRSPNASMASASMHPRTAAAAARHVSRPRLAAQNVDDEPEGSEPPLVLHPVESLYRPPVQSFTTPAPINSYHQPAQYGAISQAPMPILTTGQASQQFKDRFLEQPSLRQAPIGSVSQPNWVYNTHLNPQPTFLGTWSGSTFAPISNAPAYALAAPQALPPHDNNADMIVDSDQDAERDAEGEYEVEGGGGYEVEDGGGYEVEGVNVGRSQQQNYNLPLAMEVASHPREVEGFNCPSNDAPTSNSSGKDEANLTFVNPSGNTDDTGPSTSGSQVKGKQRATEQPATDSDSNSDASQSARPARFTLSPSWRHPPGFRNKVAMLVPDRYQGANLSPGVAGGAQFESSEYNSVAIFNEARREAQIVKMLRNMGCGKAIFYYSFECPPQHEYSVEQAARIFRTFQEMTHTRMDELINAEVRHFVDSGKVLEIVEGGTMITESDVREAVVTLLYEHSLFSELLLVDHPKLMTKNLRDKILQSVAKSTLGMPQDETQGQSEPATGNIGPANTAGSAVASGSSQPSDAPTFTVDPNFNKAGLKSDRYFGSHGSLPSSSAFLFLLSTDFARHLGPACLDELNDNVLAGLVSLASAMGREALRLEFTAYGIAEGPEAALPPALSAGAIQVDYIRRLHYLQAKAMKDWRAPWFKELFKMMRDNVYGAIRRNERYLTEQREKLSRIFNETAP